LEACHARAKYQPPRLHVMMIRKSLFEELGGFDDHFLPCTRRWTYVCEYVSAGCAYLDAHALLLYHQSISRSRYYDKSDRCLLLERWQQTIERGDPYYNPNLSLERGDYGRR
jgi:O-antigen biosynthesis protein